MILFTILYCVHFPVLFVVGNNQKKCATQLLTVLYVPYQQNQKTQYIAMDFVANPSIFSA